MRLSHLFIFVLLLTVLACSKSSEVETSASDASATITVVATPYGESKLEMKLFKVKDAPIYYVLGFSGVPDTQNEGHTSNAGFVVTDAGVVVFDALGTPALGYRLLQRIREVTEQSIERVIISHYHADHIYGLQAFEEHAGNPPVWAQVLALGYVGGSTASQGEDAERRLAQRREALFPWVDENTRIISPSNTFEDEMSFVVGGVSFMLKHLGPAHAPADSILLVKDYGVLFSGDVIYKGRVPFLDSPETDTKRWLRGLEYLVELDPPPNFVIPGHGEPSQSVEEAITTTSDYINYVRDAMSSAAENFAPFEDAYNATDWSAYKEMPAFEASNRGNAYRIFLELEAESFE
jgi:glyoxylase-like metal-dependent hydrolase (beta-lactamase superfamily II)